MVQEVLEKEPLSEQTSSLRHEQDARRRQRKELSKTLRLAEKKKARLRKRAQALTDEGLIQVLMMRKDQRETAAAEARADMHHAQASATRADESGQHHKHAQLPCGGTSSSGRGA